MSESRESLPSNTVIEQQWGENVTNFVSRLFVVYAKQGPVMGRFNKVEVVVDGNSSPDDVQQEIMRKLSERHKE